MSTVRKNYRFKLVKLPFEPLRRVDMSPGIPDIATKRRTCHQCDDPIFVGQECFAYVFLDSKRHLQRVNQCVECARKDILQAQERITRYRSYLRKQYKRATYLSTRYGIMERRAAKTL